MTDFETQATVTPRVYHHFKIMRLQKFIETWKEQLLVLICDKLLCIINKEAEEYRKKHIDHLIIHALFQFN